MGALEECNAMANAMGQSTGIDTDRLFSNINVLEQNDASDLRGVRRRQAQGQQTSKIGPAFNDESAVLGQQFESILTLTTDADNVEPFAREGGIGVGTNSSDLQLTVRATSGIQENSFVPPTSDIVRDVMPTTTKPQKKARKSAVVDPELERRKEKAELVMAEHGISPDQKGGNRRRC